MHQDEPPAKVTPRKRKKTWHITEPARKKAKKAGPKRPLSAFMFFSKTRRKELKVQHPDMDFGEIGRQVGAMWQELSVEERKVYLFFRSPVFSITKSSLMPLLPKEIKFDMNWKSGH